MRRWTVSSRYVDGKSQYQLVVWNEPRWVHAVEALTGQLCWITGGLLGGHPRWRWLDELIYRIPLGRPRYDKYFPREDGYPANSIGAALCDFESQVFTLGNKYSAADRALRVDITEAEAEKVAPDFVAHMRELDSDD